MPSLNPDARSLLTRRRDEQSARWHDDKRVSVKHFLAEYPQLNGDADALVALILNEAMLRDELGDPPSLDE